MIVRWNCDCVGLDGVKNEKGESLVLRPCDDDGRNYYNVEVRWRPMADKASAPLTPKEVGAMVQTLVAITEDANRHRTALRTALAVLARHNK